MKQLARCVKMAAEPSKVEVIEKLKKRVCQIREKAAKDYTEEEINKRIADVFNGTMEIRLS